MTCEDFRSDYLLHALGTLTDPELSELQAHLATGCAECQAGMREARVVAYSLGENVDGPDPPRRLRGRVLAAVAEAEPGSAVEKKRNWLAAWMPAVVSAALVAVIATVFYRNQARNSAAELAKLRVQVEQSQLQAASMSEAFQLLQAPETREVSFGDRPEPPRGRVFVHPSAVLLIASNLPALPAGKTYEMWIIRGGKPAPAGLFAASAQGGAVHLYKTPTPAQPRDTVAVTVEVAGGTAAPTSTPIIVAPL